jgi:hypothetical protein
MTPDDTDGTSIKCPSTGLKALKIICSESSQKQRMIVDE